MTPGYLDLHIHTSPDPNSVNESYDLDTLLKGIRSIADGSEFLISFTDHNFVNKKVYLEAVQTGINVLLGAEIHIEYDKTRKPYHCHIFFGVPAINETVIGKINQKLDKLYPNKVVKFGDQNIPHLEDVVNEFDEFDFLLLPHGGQSHSTFDRSVPEGKRFDTTMERSIYYNQFDGFTARGDTGLEQTKQYFSKLGINEFVNLVTCTDNYSPKDYPNSKAADAEPFVPTWMNALPTFSGLRLSLSESSRLVYGVKPKLWSEYIQSVKLKNDLVNIDVTLTPGLNVVIGGSSSGKTLFVDSVYRKILDNFEDTKYAKFGVSEIFVQNPSNILPHYIHQNYIVELISEASGKSIADIEIVRKIFPGDLEIAERVRSALSKLKHDLSTLMSSVKAIEDLKNDLLRIPAPASLIQSKTTVDNYFKKLLPTPDESEKLAYSLNQFESHIASLNTIESFAKKNLFTDYKPEPFLTIRESLQKARDGALFETGIRKLIRQQKEEMDAILSAEDSEQQSKKENHEKLILLVQSYVAQLQTFHTAVDTLHKYSINCKTQEVESMGHKLFIDNQFELTKTTLLETFNKYLKTDCKLESLASLTPEQLFDSCFKKQNPKVHDYDDFANKVYKDLEEMNRMIYRIVTSGGKKFEDLSAGWKTSILLDLILGYKGDLAPLIIDQPEDNLATHYINHGLISAIKTIKNIKQIVLVSHNATIPMLGDAQNVVVCMNDSSIKIRSDHLEGAVHEKSVVDHIAEITDGGKSSIKKRVKKYNLKQYREETR